MQRLLTLDEVAKELRIERRTLYLWVKQKRIKAIKLPNGKVRIESGELERVLRDSGVDKNTVHYILSDLMDDKDNLDTRS